MNKIDQLNREAQERLEQRRLIEENARRKQKEILQAQKRKEDEENAKLMQDLDNLAEDEDLLKGLEECQRQE